MLQEIIRHRETLAAATAEERARVEELIRTREDETAALAQSQEMTDWASRTLYDALQNLRSEGEGVEGVFRDIATPAAEAFTQAALPLSIPS